MIETLFDSRVYDHLFDSHVSTSNGMKISIQGKCIVDSVFIYERLHKYLLFNLVPFKVASPKRYNHDHPEQSRKTMSIYCPDDYNFSELCEKIYSLIMDYKGWYDIKTPTSYEHYAGGLYTRCDRDENGNYIPANQVDYIENMFIFGKHLKNYSWWIRQKSKRLYISKNQMLT